ncbi:ribonuclease H1 domain-containing protein [Alkalibacterium pelagium]|jgi:ribonuclease HI|uniref:Ribonuclease H n=1 Tax=Alkalibacterium pelagium TaxID=426702 RepID=A0A1H7FM74_9LACT|nr:ribonuclease H family protein [Alkalibacterium pelagium]GEN49353.1 RNase H [Alkalibacterium pelagium]SEK25542.1 ribonuclease HI [Alkalibacterium pelagium]
MPKKYYAVKKGRQTGVFTTWSDAQKVISGYSNAEFKSFTTKTEAEDYLKGSDSASIEETPESVIAYVDGSFDKRAKKYSYGVVMIKDGKVVDELSNAADDPKYAESFQIAGECFGALNAIKWAVSHGYQSVIIHYDYLGIEMWATERWKANKTVSKDYVTYFKKYAQEINVHFVKVKAHTGVLYNERADQLAKLALK